MLTIIWLNIYILSISKINTIKIKFLICCVMHAEVNRLSEYIVPRGLFCPISLDLMEDPVVDSFGHTYERQKIETWLGFPHITSPMTGLPYVDGDVTLRPNVAVREMCLNQVLRLRIIS